MAPSSGKYKKFSAYSQVLKRLKSIETDKDLTKFI